MNQTADKICCQASGIRYKSQDTRQSSHDLAFIGGNLMAMFNHSNSESYPFPNSISICSTFCLQTCVVFALGAIWRRSVLKAVDLITKTFY